jgi:hypothetical protein
MPHKPETAPEVQAGTGVRPGGEHNVAAPVKAGADPPKFDRTAYQREYMRRRRAAQKEQEC